MCLKFQLTSASTDAIVAKAMCRMSAAYLGGRISGASYAATRPTTCGVIVRSAPARRSHLELNNDLGFRAQPNDRRIPEERRPGDSR